MNRDFCRELEFREKREKKKFISALDYVWFLVRPHVRFKNSIFNHNCTTLKSVIINFNCEDFFVLGRGLLKIRTNIKNLERKEKIRKDLFKFRNLCELGSYSVLIFSTCRNFNRRCKVAISPTHFISKGNSELCPLWLRPWL